MRGRVVKFLRREAAAERAGERGVTRTGWSTDSRGTVLLSPHSVRALSQKLKDKYRRMRSGRATMTAAEERSAGIKSKKSVERHRPKRQRKPMPLIQRTASLIQRPLMLILEYCQPAVERHPVTREIVNVTPHATWKRARIAADRGNGRLVREIARQFA